MRDGGTMLVVTDPAAVAHDGQDGVAPTAREIGPLLRRVAVRRANHCREQRRFIETERTRSFVEVESRRFIDAENRRAVVMAEVNVVKIQLQEIVLGKASIECEGQRAFDDLASPRSFV